MTKQFICSTCGHIGNPKNNIKGNTSIELVLWLFFIIPGLIYSIWRSTSRYKGCSFCGSSNLIPLDSPVGKKLLQEQGRVFEDIVKEDKEKKMGVMEKLKIGLIVLGAVVFLSIVGYALI